MAYARRGDGVQETTSTPHAAAAITRTPQPTEDDGPRRLLLVEDDAVDWRAPTVVQGGAVARRMVAIRRVGERAETREGRVAGFGRCDGERQAGDASVGVFADRERAAAHARHDPVRAAAEQLERRAPVRLVADRHAPVNEIVGVFRKVSLQKVRPRALVGHHGICGDGRRGRGAGVEAPGRARDGFRPRLHERPDEARAFAGEVLEFYASCHGRQALGARVRSHELELPACADIKFQARHAIDAMLSS